MAGMTTYNDISPRTEAFASKNFLEVGLPYYCFEIVANALQVPKNNSKTITMRKFDPLAILTTPAVEGVTPPATEYGVTDVPFTLDQWIAWVLITDVILDTHEDPVLQQVSDRLGEQCAESMEVMRFGKYKAGTNVTYANGTTRDALAGTITRTKQRQIVAALKSARAKKISRTIRSTASYGTQAVNAAFFAIAHPNMEPAIRDMDGFKAVEDYGQITPFLSEVGACEECRYLITDIAVPWEDAGAAPNGTYKSTRGVGNDVYPILYFGRDAVATVALRTYPFKNSNGKTEYVKPVDLIVRNPKPDSQDPAAQRGSVAYKTYNTAGIQNDLWMMRFEGCAPV